MKRSSLNDYDRALDNVLVGYFVELELASEVADWYCMKKVHQHAEA